VSARRRLPSRLGCALGAGLRLLGSRRWLDTVVADTVVAAISDAAGKAVTAGVAEQALPEPYVPGSDDRVCGASAGAGWLRRYCWWLVRYRIGLRRGCCPCLFPCLFGDEDVIGSFVIALSVCICGLLPALPAFEALKAGNRFSRLLRRSRRSAHGHGDGLEAWSAHADT
jgi:hypothetical protein